MHFPNSDKPVTLYSLDVIISVGYRVKSQDGIIFRKWANKILKDYMLKGYAVNQKRLDYLEKTVKLINIANCMDDRLEGNDAKEVLKAIGEYSKALDLLDDYDHRTLSKIEGNNSNKKINYNECLEIINKLKFNNNSDIFALERDNGLEAIIGDIYQTFDMKDVYPSIEEKASNFYNILYRDYKQIIDNNSLVALTLLIVESNPKEKNLITDLIMNFLD